MTWEVIQGDCLEVMRGLPPASVDACITDPPYGTTACAWDSVIPFAPMWAELKRIVKPKGAIVLFGSQPFTSALVMSNPTMFRYQWYWNKSKAGNFTFAETQPLRTVEDVCAFSREPVLYNPQMVAALSENIRPRGAAYEKKSEFLNDIKSNQFRTSEYHDESLRYPTSLLNYKSTEGECNQVNRLHSTQKPVDLLRYLVRTYTNAGDTVLDFTCGSGTTGVACEIEGRNSINIDSDGHYCEVARARMMRASGIAADIPRRVKEYPPTPLFEGVEAA